MRFVWRRVLRALLLNKEIKMTQFSIFFFGRIICGLCGNSQRDIYDKKCMNELKKKTMEMRQFIRKAVKEAEKIDEFDGI